MARMPTIPFDQAGALLAIKEIIERREGMRGDNAEKVVTLADLQPGPWQTPTFVNSWVNFGSGYNNAGYYKDVLGIVRLRGLIMSGTVGSACFVLPIGYRPAARTLFSTISNGAIGRVDVMTTGEVVPTAPSVNAWVSLEGLAFRVA